MRLDAHLTSHLPWRMQAPLPVAELKRVIEMLPLERSAVAVVAPCLATLEPADFAALLSELARDNHAFR